MGRARRQLDSFHFAFGDVDPSVVDVRTTSSGCAAFTVGMSGTRR